MVFSWCSNLAQDDQLWFEGKRETCQAFLFENSGTRRLAALADFYAFCQESSNVDMPLDKERGVNAIQERQGWEFFPDRIKALPTSEKVVE